MGMVLDTFNLIVESKEFKKFKIPEILNQKTSNIHSF